MSGQGDDSYLVWLHEHGRWWESGKRLRDLPGQSRPPHLGPALDLCARAISGSLHAQPELPVLLAECSTRCRHITRITRRSGRGWR